MATVTTARNVSELLLERVAATPDAEAFLSPEEGGWRATTWKQFGERARNVSCGLRALGLLPEQRVAILAGTRLEWIVADSGIICAGGATTTIYPSNTAEESAFILNDSGTVFVFAENADQVTKLLGKRAELPNVKKVITFDPAPDHGGWVMPRRSSNSSAPRSTRARRRPSSTCPRHRAQGAGHAHLHLGHHRAAQGVELTHDCWIQRIGGDRRRQDLDAQRRAVPLAPAQPRLRQGAASGAVPPRLQDRGRRPGRQAAREHGPGEADLRGRGAAHLREGLQPRHRRRQGERRRHLGDLRVGAGSGKAGLRAHARGQVAGAVPGAPARHRAAARLLEVAGAVRRTAALLHLRLGAALAADERVLPRHGRGHPRGLRPHRELGGVVHQPARLDQVRHRGQGARRHRDPDRQGRRRDPAARPRHHARLPRPARGHRGVARRRGLPAHRRHRRARRAGPPAHHRSQEGSRSRPRWASTSRRKISRGASRRFVPTRARSSCTGTTGTSARR